MYKKPTTISELWMATWKRHFTWRYHGQHGELRRRVWHTYPVKKPDGRMRDLIAENVCRENALLRHLMNKHGKF